MIGRDNIGRFVEGHAFLEESLKKMSESHKGRIPWNKGKITKPKTTTKKGTPEYKAKMSETARQRQQKLWADPIYRKKMSEAQKDKVLPEGTKIKISEALKKTAWAKGKHLPEETRQKLSESLKGRTSPNKGKKFSEELRNKLSLSHRGVKFPAERRQKCRLRTGEKAGNWHGGISFLPYCHKFNDELKEQIRNRDNRTCQLCRVKENGEKLSVHHVHYDKENCEPDLITLCRSCNCKVNKDRDYWESHFIDLLRQQGLIEQVVAK